MTILILTIGFVALVVAAISDARSKPLLPPVSDAHIKDALR